MKFKLVESIDNRLVEKALLEYHSDIYDLPEKPGIYCYIFNTQDKSGNIIQKKYVGQSINLRARNKDHEKAAASRQTLFYRCLRKYKNYNIIPLEIFNTIDHEQLNLAEIDWIAKLHTFYRDGTQRNETISINHAGKTYILDCNGPGLNMTLGGDSISLYSKADIEFLLAIYRDKDYNHRATLAYWRELHPDSTLCQDTLKKFIVGNDLPWNYEDRGPKDDSNFTASRYNGEIVVYANKSIPTIKKEVNKKTYNADGSIKHIYYKDRHTWEIEINQDSPKYRREVKSANHAYALARLIYNRVMADLGDKLRSIKNVNKLGGHAYWIHLLDELGIYDKYLDLLQYSDEDIEANLKEDSRIPNSGVIMEYYGSFLYAIPSRFEKSNTV